LRQIIRYIIIIVVLLWVELASNQEMVLAKDKGRNKSTSTPNKTSYSNAANANQGNLSNLAYSSYPSSEDSIKAKVDSIASYYKLDSNLVRIIVEQESSFNPNARSSADAMGLMQMIPSTAKRFGVKDPYNPDESLHGGCRYFVWLLRRYNGRLDLALGGYNAGEGAVEKYGNRVPPYKETQDYVRSITKKYLAHLRSRQVSTNTLANQTVKYASNQYKSQYKLAKPKGKNHQYKNNLASVKTTKEKLDILDDYFQKTTFRN